MRTHRATATDDGTREIPDCGPKAWGALLVLGINAAMLLVGGCATLLVQRAFARREARSASA